MLNEDILQKISKIHLQIIIWGCISVALERLGTSWAVLEAFYERLGDISSLKLTKERMHYMQKVEGLGCVS